MTNRELAFVKPDAIERKLVGKIIERFEDNGFKIIRIRKGAITKELAELLYPDSEEQLTSMGKKTMEAMLKKDGKEMLMKLFNTEEPFEIGKELNSWNRKYALSAEVIAMVLEKEDAANSARALIGKTDPAAADKGTIRGDWGDDSIYKANIEKRACRTLVHASDDGRAAVEIGYFEKYFF